MSVLNVKLPEMIKPFFVTLLIVSALSCNAPKNTMQSESTVTLSAIAKKSSRFEGKEVRLEGKFLGWKYAECHFPKSFSPIPVKRSDWVIGDAKWCCFVTGFTPQGLDPASSDQVPVELTALVKRKDKKVYLELIKVIVK
jgi:hypothetical protein